MRSVIEDPSTEGPSTDGRRRRRQQNRAAVLCALTDLFGDGHYQPSADEIAARAGISVRSLFRYFDDTDDLHRAAIEQHLAIARPLRDPNVDPADPTEVKVQHVAEARVAMWDAVAPSARAARVCAHRLPVVAAQLHDTRASLRRQLRELFAPEFERVGLERLPAIDALGSFETYELLRHDQRMSAAAAVDALVHGWTALLEGPR